MTDKSPATRFFRMVCPPQDMDRVAALLRAEGFEFTPENISPWAFRLLDGPLPLGSSLAAFFGLIYIQDRSSMLPPLVLAPPPDATALDMCASPGGKTGLLAQLVGPGGLVLGNEPNPARLATLRRNLETANLMHTATCRADGEKLGLAPGAWPYILLDPPCSGWGTAEKHPQVMKLWKGDKIKPLIGLQRALLRRAAQLLPPGGRLVYSTCTTNNAENEGQAAWAQEHLGLVPTAFLEPGREHSEPLTRLNITGGQGEGQGFFVALFSKPGEPGETGGPGGPGSPGAHDSAQSPPDFAQSPPNFGQNPPPGDDTRAAWWSTWRERLIDRDLLNSACLEASRLPPGEVAAFNENLIFMPANLAVLVPASVTWRGFGLGKFTAGVPRPSPRLRGLMRGPQDCPALDVDEPETIRRLQRGNSLGLDAPGREAGLYFQGLPLGLLRLAGGRAMWSEG